MKVTGFWKPVLVSLIATPILLFLGVLSGGAGHGDYVVAKILFPYTMLSAEVYGMINPPFIILAVIQFPLYGIALAAANVKAKLLPLAVALFAVHAIAAVACFLIIGENFS